MTYLVLSLSISLANLSAPLSCMFQCFRWQKANEAMLSENENTDQVPKTIEEMRKLIETLKGPTVHGNKDRHELTINVKGQPQ